MKRTLTAIAAAFALAGISTAHAGSDKAYVEPFNATYLLGANAAEARQAHAAADARAERGLATREAYADASFVAPFDRSYLLGTKVAELRNPNAAATAREPAARARTDPEERGRYLIRIGGCNDCHTAGYLEATGNLPESQWLLGSSVGFKGPWGTTYPANLRLALAPMTEAQWLARARSEMRPPMPWFNLRDMTDEDLKAIYRYVRRLGAAGQPAPAFAAPGQKVDTPYIVFEPQNLPARHARKE